MKAPALIALVTAPFLLAACETVTTTTVAAPEGSVVATAPAADGSTVVAVQPGATNVADTCNAARYQDLVGQKSPAVSVPAGTEFRHYRTGQATTQDFNGSRVNFEYDRSGKLVSVTCG
ncbi:I78 family peptidase inhibitor [Paracoccus sp. p4-l81]|uniref:I78 family peptidase inhibitor n=1 Tax=Paracoccus sp. p4-l81 TaxID=3342806 RepID=UPI0035B9AFEB